MVPPNYVPIGQYNFVSTQNPSLTASNAQVAALPPAVAQAAATLAPTHGVGSSAQVGNVYLEVASFRSANLWTVISIINVYVQSSAWSSGQAPRNAPSMGAGWNVVAQANVPAVVQIALVNLKPQTILALSPLGWTQTTTSDGRTYGALVNPTTRTAAWFYQRQVIPQHTFQGVGHGPDGACCANCAEGKTCGGEPAPAQGVGGCGSNGIGGGDGPSCYNCGSDHHHLGISSCGYPSAPIVFDADGDAVGIRRRQGMGQVVNTTNPPPTTPWGTILLTAALSLAAGAGIAYVVKEHTDLIRR